MDSEQGPDATAQPEVDRVAPPAYDNCHVGLGNSGLPIPPPATSGKLYFESQAEETIELGLCPEPPYYLNENIGNNGPGPQTWFARLKFKCDNVPQLMREGLLWTMFNEKTNTRFRIKRVRLMPSTMRCLPSTY